MKKIIFRLFVILLTVGLIGYLVGKIDFSLDTSTAYAVGDLTIDWGVPTGDPIFNFDDVKPGDIYSHDVDVANGAAAERNVGVRGDKTSETENLSAVLDFVIARDGIDIYGGASATGPKTLADFFADSADPTGLPLSTLGAGDNLAYTFTAAFQETANDDHQNGDIFFDITIGVAPEIPSECKGLIFDGEIIYGTDGDDNLTGTNDNDLIFGFEGNDQVNGRNGVDCIVGGEGDDDLRGGGGNDYIFGNEGNDEISGDNGNDQIFGGDGDDEISGGNNNDIIKAGNGNDDVSGDSGNDIIYSEGGGDTVRGGGGNDIINSGDGNDDVQGNNGSDIIDVGEGNDDARGDGGNDIIYGRAGNDELRGGSGRDIIFGHAGDDKLWGGSGNDILNGGTGIDTINGGLGTDICIGESKTQCEI